MARSLVTIVLIAVILALLIPITTDIFINQPAFTPDNLVQLDVVFK
ncbi:hypothetical protein [Syntrophomonas erecta]